MDHYLRSQKGYVDLYTQETIGPIFSRGTKFFKKLVQGTIIFRTKIIPVTAIHMVGLVYNLQVGKHDLVLSDDRFINPIYDQTTLIIVNIIYALISSV